MGPLKGSGLVFWGFLLFWGCFSFVVTGSLIKSIWGCKKVLTDTFFEK